MTLCGPHRVGFALRTPLRASWGELREREVLRVRLDFPDGLWRRGRGGSAGALRRRARSRPSAPRSTPTRAVLRRPSRPPTLLAACAAERDLPQALAAIDLALWDHASRRTGTPLAQLIDPRAAASVPVNATIGAEDRAGAAAAAAARRARGLPLREGQGRHRRRRRPARRRARRRRAGRRHPRRRQRRVGTPEEALAQPARAGAGRAGAVRGAGARRRGAARGAAPTRRCRSRWTRPHAPGLPAPRDARLPEDHRAAGSPGVLDGRRARRARPGADVYLASTFDGPLRDRRRRPRRGGAADHARLRAGDAGGLRRARRASPDARGGSIAVPAAPGLA